MAYALYVQYGLHLEPCPLCIFQRLAVIGLGVLFLLAGLHNPGQIGARIYGALIGLVALAGMAVAGRHIYIQHLPADLVPACGAPLDQLLKFLPLRQVVERVLRGDGECAKVDWTFLGLSMPECVLIVLLVVGFAGVWLNYRRQRAAN
jgi:disulfide bond formation protein DsbB